MEANETVTLLTDVKISYTGNNTSGTPNTYVMAEGAAMDLNGKTLTVASNDRFMFGKDNCSIKNGTIKSEVSSSGTKISYVLAATASPQNFVIENITCEGGIEALGNGAAVTLRDVTVTAKPVK